MAGNFSALAALVVISVVPLMGIIDTWARNQQGKRRRKNRLRRRTETVGSRLKRCKGTWWIDANYHQKDSRLDSSSSGSVGSMSGLKIVIGVDNKNIENVTAGVLNSKAFPHKHFVWDYETSLSNTETLGLIVSSVKRLLHTEGRTFKNEIGFVTMSSEEKQSWFQTSNSRPLRKVVRFNLSGVIHYAGS